MVARAPLVAVERAALRGVQGLNKSETAAQYGEEQVKVWRRTYDIPPPPLEPTDPRYPGNEPRYAELSAAELPRRPNA